MSTITGHMVVKNEERWIWYSIMSVIEYLDKLIIYDNGSTDSTVDIIKRIMMNSNYRDKIIFEEKGPTNKKEYTKLRQEQLDITDTDYFMIIDGDEIWWKNSVKEIIRIINSEEPPMLVATHFINCAGDVYHYRLDERESYCINNVKGAITIRVLSKKIPGIHLGGDYGVEGYFDCNNKPVQNNVWSTVIQEGKFLHTSYLQRSRNVAKDSEVYFRVKKLVYQNGWDRRFDKDFKYPEVFYENRPDIVHTPWDRVGFLRWIVQITKLKRVFSFMKK